MPFKVLAAALVLCSGVALFAGTYVTQRTDTAGAKQARTERQDGDPTTLKARVKKIRLKGEKKATFSSPVPIYAETSGLEEASSTYLIVAARPTEARTFLSSPHKLTTYQKFEIIERLNAPPSVGCCGPQASDIPPGLPPPGADEIYVRMNGGTAVIDEVEVTQEPEFNFESTETYLLFLLPDSAATVSTIPLGPYGVFNLKGNSIESLLDYPHVLDAEIKGKHGRSLPNLRAALHKSRGKK
jgi:hypothetical protein